MDENLVGYLLNSLDEPSHQQVEAYLAGNAAGRDKVQKLHRALEPLEADREQAKPPADLVYRTLARVAEVCSQGLPRAPVTIQAGGNARPLWRRVDVVAAAAILLLALGVGIPALFRLRDQSGNLECQDNLRIFYTGLKKYHDQHKQFPDVDAHRPHHNVAGMVVPMLIHAKVLAPDVSIRCPGNGPGKPCPLTLDQIKAMGPEEFKKHAASLASCYAYSLGYRDDLGYHAPVMNAGMASRLPLMSDRPPYDDDTLDNSPNHGKNGQNVLFQDGHVEFMTKRSLPFDDDIFKNRQGKRAAGDAEDDVVLGNSAIRP